MNAAVRPSILDLFCGAAGGWSAGMHAAGFQTIAACELIDWRRILFSQNNPGVALYEDVRSLTRERLVCDLGWLPDVIVGSPPCQDVSSANTKGKGIDGERSGLYFEAVRLVGECRPRWFAFENSANLRTRGADRLVAAFQAIGYAVELCVVGADDVKANHERKRSWLIGYDPEQVTDPASLRCVGGRPRRHGSDGDCAAPTAPSDGGASKTRNTPDADQAGQADGCLVAGLRQTEIADDGRGHVGGNDVADANIDGESSVTFDAEVGGGEGVGGNAFEPWPDWNGGLAHHLRMDDGLSAWVAGARVAVGGPRGTSAASLIVEAFGDAVLPQITEVIGRAILRTDAALRAIYSRHGDRA